MTSNRWKKWKPSKTTMIRRAVTAVPNPVYPEHGDILTFSQFVECVSCGALIDYDGYGIWSDGTFVPGYPNFRSLEGDDLEREEWRAGWHDLEPTHLGLTGENMNVRPSEVALYVFNRPTWATHVLWFNK